MKQSRFYQMLLLMFCSYFLNGQSLEVYKKFPSTNGNCAFGNCLTYNFNGDLKLIPNPNNPSTFIMDHDVIKAHSPLVFGSNNLTVTNSQDRKYLMTYYHLSQALDFCESVFGIGTMSLIEFNQSYDNFADKPQIQVSKLGGMDQYMVDYSYDPGVYNAVGEDAFTIASGLIKAYYVKAVGGLLENLPLAEGLDYAIQNYYAFQYMESSNYVSDSGTKIFEHGGIGSSGIFSWVTLDMILASSPYNGFLYDNISPTDPFQKQSELLSATLWRIKNTVGTTKMNALITSTLPQLSSQNEMNQVKAALFIYNNSYEWGVDGSGNPVIVNLHGFTDTDRCEMHNIFTKVYGSEFSDEIDNLSLPPAQFGDIYIKDYVSHEGEEITSGSIINSPSIWNRRFNDGIKEHQSPYDFGSEPAVQYLSIGIDGNYCDIKALVDIVGDVHYKIYRSVPKLGFQWESDWNRPLVHNAPEGDLIGTFYVKDPETQLPTYKDDEGNIVPGVTYSNDGNLLVITFPWEVPDYLFDVWLPNVAPKDNSNLGIEFQDAFLVRIESSNFDPIGDITVEHPNGYSEVSNVYTNVASDNNIAMKVSNIVIAQECSPCDGDGPTIGFLLPEDDDPTEYVISIDPSTHDPVRPPNGDPLDPIVPVLNNYMDYGEVAIVLDEDTHQEWLMNGSQGHGFIVNSDDEIIVTSPNFTLTGIPRTSTSGHIRAMGVRYYAANGVLTSRTGFDIVAADANGNDIGSIHFEVRESDSNSIPRKHQATELESDISIYPNPIDGDILHVTNLVNISSYSILSMDGKMYNAGRLVKDQNTIDISTLTNGVYVIQFTLNNGKIHTEKLIRM